MNAWLYGFGRWGKDNNMRLSAARTEKRVKAAFAKTVDCETTCSKRSDVFVIAGYDSAEPRNVGNTLSLRDDLRV